MINEEKEVQIEKMIEAHNAYMQAETEAGLATLDDVSFAIKKPEVIKPKLKSPKFL